MKLIADVNISPRVVEHLRSAGCDAVRITELIDARSSDEDVLAEGVRQGALADSILTVLREAADELAAGAIVTLDDGGARMHRLSIR